MKTKPKTNVDKIELHPGAWDRFTDFMNARRQ